MTEILIMSKHCKLILALDLPNKTEALEMLEKLQGSLEWVKIGLQMYLKYGPDFVKQVGAMGFKVFLDLKLYDIPNTVASAIKSLADLPISMLTIHASGGEEMMRDALKAAKEAKPDLLILAVTVLTSFDDEGLAKTGVGANASQQVVRLAKLAEQSGIEGLVCSPLEIEILRKSISPNIALVTPGIRPAGSDANEQKRIMTPSLAASAGANYIVVGRPILKAQNPAKAAQEIIAELSK